MEISNRSRLTSLFLASTFLAISAAVPMSVTMAATITVTSTSDVNINDAVCTLREALISANTDSNGHENDCTRGDAGEDSIVFSPTVFPSNQTTTIFNTAAPAGGGLQFEITSDVVITGPGRENLILDGQNFTRVLLIQNSNVTLTGLTIQNGQHAPFAAPRGGGILIEQDSNQNQVFLTNLGVRNNSTAGGGGIGGGLAITGGRVIIENSEIRDNFSSLGSGAGGGLAITGGRVTIENSAIRDNSSSVGGGVFTRDATVDINDSQLSENQASRGGSLNIASGNVTILRTSIANNTGFTEGGGIRATGGSLMVNSSTIHSNSALNDSGGGLHGDLAIINFVNSTVSSNDAETVGGGLHVIDSRVTMRNTTLSDNSNGAAQFDQGSIVEIVNSVMANSALRPDCQRDSSVVILSTVNQRANNLIENLGGSSASNCLHIMGQLVLQTEPQLGSLQNNGGPTLTHRPSPSSPLIGAGLSDTSCTMPDQRGVPRVDGICDIGSVTQDRDSGFFVIPLESGAVVIPI